MAPEIKYAKQAQCRQNDQSEDWKILPQKCFTRVFKGKKIELTKKGRLLMAPSPIGFHAWQPIIWEQSVSEGSYGIDGVKWNLCSSFEFFGRFTFY